MARIRTIKPEFWSSPEAMAMSRDARLLVLGLISAADDHGRFLASVPAIIGAVFPNDQDVTPAKLQRWLDEVTETGMVTIYEVRGVRYGVFPSWEKHQKVARPTPSRIPDPPTKRTTKAEQAHDNDSASSMGNPEKPVAGSARVKDLGSGILDQGSGIVTPLASLVAPDDDEPAPKSKRGTRLDPSFVPSEASRVAVITDHPTLDLRREHAKFVDYWTAKPGQNATKVDWDATWRNWMRKAGEDLARHRPANRDQFAGAIARADAAEATIPGELA